MRKVSIALLVRIAVVLALLTSLVAISAVPVAAAAAGTVVVTISTDDASAVLTNATRTGRADTTYLVTWQSEVGVAANAAVVIDLPVGATNVGVAAASVQYGTGASAALAQAALATNGAGSAVVLTTASRITLTWPNAAGGISPVVVNGFAAVRFLSAGGLVGILNPVVDGATDQLTVQEAGGLLGTSADIDFVDSVDTVAVVATPNTAGNLAAYTVTFNVGPAGALVEDVGTIALTFPTGTVIPANVPAAVVAVTGVPTSSVGVGTNTAVPAAPTVVGRVVTITTPVAVANNAAVVVTFAAAAGITNPTTSTTTAQVSVVTSSEIEAPVTGQLAFYTIGRYVSFTPSTTTEGGAVTLTGGGFTAGASIGRTAGPVTGSSTVNSDGTFTISATRSSAVAAAITVTDGAGLAVTSATTLGLLPDLTVTPATGIAQGAISVAGRNFTAGGNVAALPGVQLTIAGVNVVALNATMVQPAAFGAAFVDRDADGVADDFLMTIRIPSGLTSGAKTLSITDAAALVATQTVTVTGRTLTLSPNTGPVGTIVTLTATGLPASAPAVNNTVAIATGPAPIALGAATDTAGGVTATFTVLAPAALGARSITVTSLGPVDGVATTASATFTVTSAATTLSLSPTTGPKGTSVVVTGTGLTNGAPSVAIGALTLGGAAWNAAGINVVGGNLAASTQTVAAGAAYGANTVLATDAGALTASSTFTVTQPTFSIAPTSGTVGTTLSIAGSGWLPSSAVFLTQNNVVITSLIASASGAISGSYTIPSTLYPGGGAGAVLYTANDGATGNTTTTSTFTISAAAITLSSASAAVGASVTVTGTGFLPLTGVAVTLGGNAMTTTPALPITDAVGSFSAAFTVPGLTGAQTVAATVFGTARTVPLTVTAAPAVTPTPDTVLAPLVTAGALNSAYSPNTATPGAFLSYIPNVPGNTLTTVAAFQTVIVNVTVAGQAIPTGFRGQPGQTTLSVGVNFLTYAP